MIRLPVRFLDAALLWQALGPTKLREPERVHDGSIKHHRAPTWSWASRQSVSGEACGVTYPKPYEVQADELGMVMKQLAHEPKKGDELGEERMRPLAHLIHEPRKLPLACNGITKLVTKLKRVGLHSQLAMVDKQWSENNLHDWTSKQDYVPTPMLPKQGLRLEQLSDRHLVLHTEVATLYLGAEVVRTRTGIRVGKYEFCRETLDQQQEAKPGDSMAGISVSKERRIIVPSDPNKTVGFAKFDDGRRPQRRNAEAVEAIILSEAQYFGHERKIDVLGYPLFNVRTMAMNIVRGR